MAPLDPRQERKLDHVRLAVSQGQRPAAGQAGPGWADVALVHQSLPEKALRQINLSSSIAGVSLRRPVIINAMTGGAPGLDAVNRDLATLAAEFGLAMALGSQTAGLRTPSIAHTFRVVREVNPDGVILGNLGASCSGEDALRAVEMVGANLLQLHLNAPQELAMAEGDRDFRGQLENIGTLVASLPVPVVVKETGFGLSRESARLLAGMGVRVLDISGTGGTNFVQIEADRSAGEGPPDVDPGLLVWGIPAPCSLLEVAALDLPGLEIIASGGIRAGSDAAKALALGARAVGVAGALLGRLQAGGIQGARQFLERMLHDLDCAALLAGAGTLAQLQRRPVVVLGETAAWSRLRGVSLEALAQRS